LTCICYTVFQGKVIMTFQYTLYGLHIHSDMPLDGLRIGADNPIPDVRVTEGAIPTHLADAHAGVLYEVTPNEFLLHMDGIAHYHVRDGVHITVQPASGADQSAVQLFLFGSALGVLLHQRGMLPMHASAIAVKGKAVLFTGASGAGKSTTAAALMQRGCGLIADDITVVYADPSGMALAAPAFPYMKLWAQSLRALAADVNGLRRVRPELEKYALPIVEHFHAEPLPVSRMYLLSAHNKPEIEIKPITGMAKLRALRQQVYRRRIMEEMRADSAHFSALTALARSTQLTTVRRTEDITRLDELIDRLEVEIHAS
jgi:hypothetical protein